MKKFIVKEGPIVFLKDVLLMEILAVIVFFGLSFVENYEMLYKNLSLEVYLRYDLFLLIASALFQFFYIIALFINWYFSYFEIKESEIIKKTGLFFSRRKSFDTRNILSIETHQSIFDRAIGHADINIEYQKDKILKMRNIPNFEEILYLIKQFSKHNSFTKNRFSIEDILREGEGSEIEFKESFRFDLVKNTVNRELERVIMKTIVGFLNTNGGMLLIGVDDHGQPKGLNKDFDSLQKKSRDGFENHFNLVFKNSIGVAFSKYVDLCFEKISGQEVCLVRVSPSHKPAYLFGPDKKEEFFIRVGNSTQPLSMSETEEYIKNHFK